MKGDKICEKARAMFLRFGIKSVSMDDISHEIGISKKTLYQFIPNKSDLVAQVLNRHFEGEKAVIDQIKMTAADPIHELILIAKHMVEMFRQISPITMYDLKKYYFSLWKEIDQKRNTLILEDVHRNLENGVKNGLYRKDLDTDLVSALYVRMAVFVSDEKILDVRKNNNAKLYGEFVKYHIRGIASEKGIAMLKQYETLLNE